MPRKAAIVKGAAEFAVLTVAVTIYATARLISTLFFLEGGW